MRQATIDYNFLGIKGLGFHGQSGRREDVLVPCGPTVYISQKSFLSMVWLGQQHCKTLEQSGPVCAAMLLYMFKKEKREKPYLRMFSSAVLITIEYLCTIYV